MYVLQAHQINVIRQGTRLSAVATAAIALNTVRTVSIVTLVCTLVVGSVAEWVKASFLRRPYRMIQIRFNLHPGHVVASLNKTLYDDYYLCLVASN